VPTPWPNPKSFRVTGAQRRVWQAFQLVVCFCTVSVVMWVGLVMSIFPNETSYWPSYLCAVLALGMAVAICRSSTLQWMLATHRLATALACLEAIFLLVLTSVATASAHDADPPLHITPSVARGIAPVHWTLMCISVTGAALGASAIPLELRRKSRVPIILASVSVGMCVLYIVLWVSAVLTAGSSFHKNPTEPTDAADSQ